MFVDDLECPITAATLFEDSTDKSLGSELSNTVSIDPTSFLIDINNNVEKS
jgi:hypothetical protein